MGLNKQPASVCFCAILHSICKADFHAAMDFCSKGLPQLNQGLNSKTDSHTEHTMAPTGPEYEWGKKGRWAILMTKSASSWFFTTLIVYIPVLVVLTQRNHTHCIKEIHYSHQFIQKRRLNPFDSMFPYKETVRLFVFLLRFICHLLCFYLVQGNTSNILRLIH